MFSARTVDRSANEQICVTEVEQSQTERDADGCYANEPAGEDRQLHDQPFSDDSDCEHDARTDTNHGPAVTWAEQNSCPETDLDSRSAGDGSKQNNMTESSSGSSATLSDQENVSENWTGATVRSGSDQGDNPQLLDNPMSRTIESGLIHSPIPEAEVGVEAEVVAEVGVEAEVVAEIEGTFLTTVTSQAEGLSTALMNDKPRSELRTSGSSGPAAGRTGQVGSIDLSFSRTAQISKRPKTSKLTGTSRNKIGSSKLISGRPQSAADVSYYLLGNSPSLNLGSDACVTMKTSVDERNIPRPDLQMGKDAWKSSTKQGWLGPATAAKQKFSTGRLFPPPQRPTSPVLKEVVKTQRLKVAKTDAWLGGGRDLYWEDIRSRPKSGHVPGWKAGLPEDMRKRRSKSAFVTSSTRLPLSDVSMTSCTNCRDKEAILPHLEKTSILMPHAHQLLQYLPPSMGIPRPEEGRFMLTTVDPNTDISYHTQRLKRNRRPVRVPLDNKCTFGSAQAGGCPFDSIEDDKLMAGNPDDEDFLCVTMSESLPVKLRGCNIEIPLSVSGPATGPVISRRVILSRSNPGYANSGGLKPIIRIKSAQEGQGPQYVVSATTFASGVQGKGIAPQAKLDANEETAIKCAAVPAGGPDSSPADGSNCETDTRSQKCRVAANDLGGKTVRGIVREPEEVNRAEGERLILHVDLTMDLEEGFM